MFGMSPPVHPSALQAIGGRHQFNQPAYDQPTAQPTAYGGIGFGLSGLGGMPQSGQAQGMSMMGTPMGGGRAGPPMRGMGGGMGAGMGMGGTGGMGMGMGSEMGAGSMGIGGFGSSGFVPSSESIPNNVSLFP
ncbi:hypothetical protein IAT38_008295 [Cryptococcus sp. DSM 104549]